MNEDTIRIQVRITRALYDEMNSIIADGFYLGQSDFIRDAIREKVINEYAEFGTKDT